MYLVIGLGKLAQSVLKLSSYKQTIFVHSRTKAKVDEYQDERVSYIAKDEFYKVSHVLLMLPSSEVLAFIEKNSHFFREDVLFYSFATALKSNDLKTERLVIPCKLAGHAKQMVEDEHGLLVIPEGENCEPLASFFGEKFTIVNGTEEEVILGNTLGTKAAIEMIIDLEDKLKELGVQPAIIKQTLSQVTRGNIKAFLNNELGGFAQQIVEEIRKGRK